MSPIRPEEIEKALRVDAGDPPAGLLEALKAQIPEAGAGEGTIAPDARRGGPRPLPRVLAAAATVGVVVLGAALWWELRETAPAPVRVAESLQPAAQPGFGSRADEKRTAEVDGDGAAAMRALELPTAMEPEGERERPPVAEERAVGATLRKNGGGSDRTESKRAEILGGASPGPSALAETVVADAGDRPVEHLAASGVAAPSRREAAPRDDRTRSLRALGYVDGSTGTADLGSRPLELPHPPAPSTGGSREPNGRAFGDMFFESAGVNPFIDTQDDRLSTFALDVDTGSFAIVRSYLERGEMPPREAVRVEEFVNAMDYADRPPTRGDFAIHLEGSVSPFAEGESYRMLRVAVVGREIPEAERKAVVLTFLIDVSGSMSRGNRIGSVRYALGRLVDQLRAGDRVGVVVYGSGARLVLEPTTELWRVRQALESLGTGGATNLEEGFRLAYRTADRFFALGAVNRVILCSDGVANVGLTAADGILASVGEAERRGIELTTVGFGMGNYNDALMERLADAGDGGYYYVDSPAEAERVFVRNLSGTLETIASEAKIQVEFDPRSVSRYRLLGYENRALADRDFRNDTVDAGEIGAGHRVTALYELKLEPGAARRSRLATVHLRYYSERERRIVEQTAAVSTAEVRGSFERASGSTRLAIAAAELAEQLRGAYWARESSFEALRGVVEHDSLLRDRLAGLVDSALRARDRRAPASGGEAPDVDADERRLRIERQRLLDELRRQGASEEEAMPQGRLPGS